MELKDLTGLHFLTGVDRQNVEVDGDVADTISFVLDGVTYTATENPQDGYRSCMNDIAISDRKVLNTFPPCHVMARMDLGGEGYRGVCEILELLDVTTGGCVLKVGTESADDYYPSYVAEFDPRVMAVNQDKQP